MFLASAPYFIDNINIALSNGDWLEIASQMHSNKTKLIMMGMKETVDLGAEIENQCREGNNTDSVKLKLRELVQQMETAVIELRNPLLS